MEYWLAERQVRGEAPVGPVYVLQGQEAFLQSRFLRLLRQRLFGNDAAVADLNTNDLDGTEQGWDAALSAARTLPFLAERRLVVLRDAPGLSGGGKAGAADGDSGDAAKSGGKDGLEDRLASFLQEPPADACLVVVATTVDKRRRLFKLFDKHAVIVDCVPLKAADMPKWMRQRVRELGGELAGDAAERLAMRLTPDLHIVDQELRKLIAYADGQPIDGRAVDTVASASAEAVIWPLLDAVGQRRPTAALDLLRQLLQQGEPPLRLLFMVTRQWRHLLHCKVLSERGASQKDIAGALGVPPFAVRNLLGQQRNFTRAQLRQGMAQLLDTDVQLKSSPTDPRLLLEMCILELCGG